MAEHLSERCKKWSKNVQTNAYSNLQFWSLEQIKKQIQSLIVNGSSMLPGLWQLYAGWNIYLLVRFCKFTKTRPLPPSQFSGIYNNEKCLNQKQKRFFQKIFVFIWFIFISFDDMDKRYVVCVCFFFSLFSLSFFRLCTRFFVFLNFSILQDVLSI